MPRGQLVLIPTALEEVIPPDHPVRLVDEILDQLDWTEWELAYCGNLGQPPIHPNYRPTIIQSEKIESAENPDRAKTLNQQAACLDRCACDLDVHKIPVLE